MRRLYHGSEKIIEKSIYGQGEKYNDYGLGFYCTDSIDMAKEWGVKKGTDGYANCYELDCNGLDILNLNDDQYCILHWLAILLQNREFDIPSRPALEAKGYILDKFSIDYERYDSIIGYRADNSYFSFAQDFINGKLGQQFVLKSEKAFSQIKFCGYEIAVADEWYQKKMLRDKNARREYFDAERNRRQKGDIYIMQIIDEEMTSDDSRLR